MSVLSLHNGDGTTFAEIELDQVDSNSFASGPLLPWGELFISVDGEGYGGIHFEMVGGRLVLTLGQYDPTFDQWAPENPLTGPEQTP